MLSDSWLTDLMCSLIQQNLDKIWWNDDQPTLYTYWSSCTRSFTDSNPPQHPFCCHSSLQMFTSWQRHLLNAWQDEMNKFRSREICSPSWDSPLRTTSLQSPLQPRPSTSTFSFYGFLTAEISFYRRHFGLPLLSLLISFHPFNQYFSTLRISSDSHPIKVDDKSMSSSEPGYSFPVYSPNPLCIQKLLFWNRIFFYLLQGSWSYDQLRCEEFAVFKFRRVVVLLPILLFIHKYTRMIYHSPIIMYKCNTFNVYLHIVYPSIHVENELEFNFT